MTSIQNKACSWSWSLALHSLTVTGVKADIWGIDHSHFFLFPKNFLRSPVEYAQIVCVLCLKILPILLFLHIHAFAPNVFQFIFVNYCRFYDMYSNKKLCT